MFLSAPRIKQSILVSLGTDGDFNVSIFIREALLNIYFYFALTFSYDEYNASNVGFESRQNVLMT